MEKDREGTQDEEEEEKERQQDSTLVGALTALVDKLSLSRKSASTTLPNKRLGDLLKENMLEKKNAKILVMVGAAISTAAGIPDFRTPGTGLYSQLGALGLPYPEAVFSIDFFRRNPEPFRRLCAEMWPTKYEPTLAHHFIKLLHDKGVLLRVYTQNIDSLERRAGIPEEKIVAAHGNFDCASCIVTKKKIPIEDVERVVLTREMTWDELHAKHGAKCIKPDIVFFGEALPERFFDLLRVDFPRADMLIVIGTSLQVQPFASLVEEVGPSVPRLLINKEKVGLFRRVRPEDESPTTRDFALLGSCDEEVMKIATHLGWDEELKKITSRQRAAGKSSTALSPKNTRTGKKGKPGKI